MHSQTQHWSAEQSDPTLTVVTALSIVAASVLAFLI